MEKRLFIYYNLAINNLGAQSQSSKASFLHVLDGSQWFIKPQLQKL